MLLGHEVGFAIVILTQLNVITVRFWMRWAQTAISWQVVVGA